MSAPNYIKLLEQRKAKGGERSLLSFDDSYSDFWSNDYLGLGKIPQSIRIASGSGSRLISGNSETIEATEAKLATFFKAESALFFNSGYDANLGLFSALPQKGDTVIYDELVHASIRDGIRLSFARNFGFRHNDLSDLRAKLEVVQGTVFVAVESIYSMDGDLAPLEALVALCEEHQAHLIVDEAHAGGIYGEKGEGRCVELHLENQVFARVITFGKAFGAHGAIVLGSSELRHFLINFSRSFIFTTALPEAFIAHVWEQVSNPENQLKREQLQQNIQFFRKQIPNELSAPTSPIQVLLFEDTATCKRLAEFLQQHKIAVKAILAPTVPENAPRLRFCLHAFNIEGEINRVVQLLNDFKA